MTCTVPGPFQSEPRTRGDDPIGVIAIVRVCM